MKRASYRDAVDWVAQMDSAGDNDADKPEVVAELVSCGLVAAIFGVEQIRVGTDVVRRRAKLAKEG